MVTSHHLPKKRGALKSTQISFLRAPQFWQSLIIQLREAERKSIPQAMAVSTGEKRKKLGGKEFETPLDTLHAKGVGCAPRSEDRK